MGVQSIHHEPLKRDPKSEQPTPSPSPWPSQILLSWQEAMSSSGFQEYNSSGSGGGKQSSLPSPPSASRFAATNLVPRPAQQQHPTKSPKKRTREFPSPHTATLNILSAHYPTSSSSEEEEDEDYFDAGGSSATKDCFLQVVDGGRERESGGLGYDGNMDVDDVDVDVDAEHELVDSDELEEFEGEAEEVQPPKVARSDISINGDDDGGDISRGSGRKEKRDSLGGKRNGLEEEEGRGGVEGGGGGGKRPKRQCTQSTQPNYTTTQITGNASDGKPIVVGRTTKAMRSVVIDTGGKPTKKDRGRTSTAKGVHANGDAGEAEGLGGAAPSPNAGGDGTNGAKKNLAIRPPNFTGGRRPSKEKTSGKRKAPQEEGAGGEDVPPVLSRSATLDCEGMEIRMASSDVVPFAAASSTSPANIPASVSSASAAGSPAPAHSNASSHPVRMNANFHHNPSNKNSRNTLFPPTANSYKPPAAITPSLYNAILSTLRTRVPAYRAAYDALVAADAKHAADELRRKIEDAEIDIKEMEKVENAEKFGKVLDALSLGGGSIGEGVKVQIVAAHFGGLLRTGLGDLEVGL